MITIKYSEPTKLACAQEIIVSFRYKKEIVDVIRLIPERYWDAKNKEWHLSYDSLTLLKENLPNEKFDIIGTPINSKKYGEKHIEKKYDLPSGLKTKLYSFQEEGFNELMNFDKYLLLYEMGCGKSILSLAVAIKRKELGQINRCLIICGVNGLKYNWESEIYLHTDKKCTILGNRKNKKGKYEVKSNKDKLEDLDNIKSNEDLFYITNIESLRDTEIKEKLKKLIEKEIINMVIFDECHTAKSPSSQQGKALLNIASKVKYFYGLTGTILMNNPLDLYVPLKLVGRETSTFNSYKYHFCTMGGYGNYSIVGYKHLDELQMKLKSVSLRKTKDEVLDLPPKIYIDEYVDMETKQKKLYNDVLKSIMEDIDNIVLSPDPLSRMTRLRQVTDFPSIIASSITESAKLNRLKEIVEEITNNGNKLLLFSNWTTVTDILYKELKEYNPCLITGQVKDRETEKQKFMTQKEHKILIGTVAAMGTGLTLTAASSVVFFDEPWTSALKQQAEDRAHRIGTQSSINIITLMCKNTIDEHIHKIIKKKQVTSDTLVDQKYDIRNKDILRYIATGEGNI